MKIARTWARIRDLQNGMWATLQVDVRIAGTYPVKGGKLRIFEISGTDNTGQIRAFWWNQGYLQNSFKQGRRVLLYGQWKRNRRGFFEVENPDYEFTIDDDDADPIHIRKASPCLSQTW
jgi:RecG-like helicase